MTSMELRHNFLLIGENHIAISKADFEANFTKTDKSIEFTFGGWDGKSYGGETRRAKILHTSIPGFEDAKLIKVGKGIHLVDEQHMMIELATGISHPTVTWVADVARI